MPFILAVRLASIKVTFFIVGVVILLIRVAVVHIRKACYRDSAAGFAPVDDVRAISEVMLDFYAARLALVFLEAMS